MAEEQQTTEQEKEKEKEKAPEHKPEEKREERREDPPKDETPTIKCPECRVAVDAADLGSHRYLAHKVERRTVKERKEDGDADQDDGAGSRTPRRKSSSQERESGSQGSRKPSGRWGKVRSSWGG